MSPTQHSTSRLNEAWYRYTRKKHWVKPLAFARTLLIFKNATTKPRVYWFHCRCFRSNYSLWSLAIVALFAYSLHFSQHAPFLCTISSNILPLFIRFSLLLPPLFLLEWLFLFFFCLFVYSYILKFKARSHVSTKWMCFFLPSLRWLQQTFWSNDLHWGTNMIHDPLLALLAAIHFCLRCVMVHSLHFHSPAPLFCHVCAILEV